MFEKVKEEHIIKGIQDFKDKGIPNGFGSSSTYDLVYQGNTYPPKAIMAYANYHASGRKVERYFKGGLGTDCFNAFEKNGFEVKPKNIPMSYENLYQLKEDFLDEWPLSRLESLTLEEYTNLDKTSFCYWLEHISEPTGGIRGGSSFKFGVYRMDSISKDASNKSNDGTYAWYNKYGNTALEAFKTIKNIVIEIAKAATEDNLQKLDNIDLGDAVKWKIAFMYSDYKVMNIFNKHALVRASLALGDFVDKKTAISTLNRNVLNHKPNDEDYYSYSQRIWEKHGQQNEKAKQFQDWLKTNENTNSRKTPSYIQAITILTNFFKVPVYDYDDISDLEDLYEDLKENQRNPNGRYFYEEAKSYGENRFYSAAIKSYIEFFKDSEQNCNYWIFQGNPKKFDFQSAIKDGSLTNFTVAAHKSSIKAGDKAIIWLTGENAGCYALAEITNEPREVLKSEDDKHWLVENENDLKADIKITHNFFNDPIVLTSEEIDVELEGLNVGHRGTNFKATKEQYEYFLNYNEQESNLEEILAKHDPHKLQKYFTFLFRILDDFKLQPNDKRLHYSTKGNRISFIIGQRFSWALFKNAPDGHFFILSIDKLREESIQFSGNRPLPYSTETNDIDFTQKELKSIYDGFEQELKRTVKSSFRKHTNLELERAVFDPEFRARFSDTYSKPKKMVSLNTILYGPPGTGKTYSTIERAIKIVDPVFYQSNKNSRNALTERFNQLLIKKWEEPNGRIAFCTFHQSFGYEDFVEGIKPKTTPDKNVIYEIENGIFKNICELANSNLSTVKVKREGKVTWDENKFSKAIFYKLSLGNSNRPEDREIYEYCRDNNYISIGYGDDLDFTNLSESQIEKIFEENVDLGNGAQRLNYFVHSLKKGDYVLISNGNKYVRALGKVVGDYEYNPNSPIEYSHFRKVEWVFVDENIPVEELYGIGLSPKSIYKMDETKLKKDFFVNSKEPEKNSVPSQQEYVLIIDEINRGNVSAIFGELITLIENDKRKGQEEALDVILPYSKEPFSVPTNLHIIGTMNTADRSVEALDTALRRRFIFNEVMPEPSLLSNIKFNGFNLEEVLDTINKRIEVLLDRDHTIGHSYFMKIKNGDTTELRKVFQNNIIPLLQEYFFNDYEKIALVLGPGFIEEKETETILFPKFKSIDEPQLETTYQLIQDIEDIEDAVLSCLGKSDD